MLCRRLGSGCSSHSDGALGGAGFAAISRYLTSTLNSLRSTEADLPPRSLPFHLVCLDMSAGSEVTA